MSRETLTWNQEFLLLELYLCAPYSNATLERFFIQMCVGKSDWQSQSNEENLFRLLSVEVDKPTVEEFLANHRGKAVSLQYNNQNHRMHQQQPKAYKKRDETNGNRISKF